MKESATKLVRSRVPQDTKVNRREGEGEQD